MLTKGDRLFLTKVAMPQFRVKRLRIEVSDSKKKWPDIWITMGRVPVITVTKEWARQNMHERRKRLVHELLHLNCLEHGMVGKYDYNTKPGLDSYSRYVYDLIRR